MIYIQSLKVPLEVELHRPRIQFDNETTMKNESAYKVLENLKTCIPQALELLGLKAGDEYHVTDFDFVIEESKGHQYCDQPLKSIGICDMQFITRRRLHSYKTNVNNGTGMILYRCRLAPHLKYVAINITDAYGDLATFLICKKGELWRISRHSKSIQRIKSECAAPILPDGILEQVMRNTINYLEDAKKIESFGVRVRRGIIIDGEPGNGKTMLCRYLKKLCKERNISCSEVSASEIDAAALKGNLTELFSSANVIFFDDIDISYFERTGHNGKTACAILSAMDGISERNNVVRIFTTNEPINNFDAAFRRPGRIDVKIGIGKPNADLRRKLMERWPKEILSTIDINVLVDRTHDMSFAEVEAVRSSLVSEFIFSGQWDIEAAFADFHEKRDAIIASLSKRALGFSKRQNPWLPEDDDD